MTRPKLLPDSMTLMLFGVVLAASFIPCAGAVAVGFNFLTTVMIALLFFMHGAKLSRAGVIAGVSHWRLHSVILLFTFVVFPVLGLILKPMLVWLVSPELYLGILFLCVLPSTVQSSIAFTSVARGNVAAAVCSASASNLIGVFLTPFLVGLFLMPSNADQSSFASILKIGYQLLLPFMLGQIARPLVASWQERHKQVLKMVDQTSILLVVYVAFSEAVVLGLWRQVPVPMLFSLVFISALMLAVVMGLAVFASRRFGFSKEDEIVLVFCGSKKSLASGVPMAKVLFASHALGGVLLPLMIFHQLQLMVCAVVAQHYALRDE